MVLLPSVLLYSEFTLLSNFAQAILAKRMVLLYSEFTLLSNAGSARVRTAESFTVFWIYTTLKPPEKVEAFFNSFTVFWIYTTLKHTMLR